MTRPLYAIARGDASAHVVQRTGSRYVEARVAQARMDGLSATVTLWGDGRVSFDIRRDSGRLFELEYTPNVYTPGTVAIRDGAELIEKEPIR